MNIKEYVENYNKEHDVYVYEHIKTQDIVIPKNIEKLDKVIERVRKKVFKGILGDVIASNEKLVFDMNNNKILKLQFMILSTTKGGD